jgi:hypothetical protein
LDVANYIASTQSILHAKDRTAIDAILKSCKNYNATAGQLLIVHFLQITQTN